MTSWNMEGTECSTAGMGTAAMLLLLEPDSLTCRHAKSGASVMLASMHEHAERFDPEA